MTNLLALMGRGTAALALVLTHALPVLAEQPVVFNLSAVRSGYLLGPGDNLKISVFEYEEYSGTQIILPDGTITLPVIGTVAAADRTPETLANEIAARLTPYLKNPIVAVGIGALRPLRINVAGAVHRPGPLQLNNFSGAPAGGLPKAPTVSVALTEAGGVSREADLRRITVRRSDGNGGSKTVTIDLWEAVTTETANREPTLQDGDSVFVPKLTASGEPLDRRLMARSSLAPRMVRVRVVGEVKNPGEVEVLSDGTIASAVAVAGGPTDKAALELVSFARLGEDGRVTTKNVNLSAMTDDNQIEQGDVVVVPKSGLSATLDFFGALLAPAFTLFRILR